MEQFFTPEAIAFFQSFFTILIIVVLILAAVALGYAIAIFHNLYKISRFWKDAAGILKRDFIGVLEKLFTDKNIKTALTAFAAWSSEAISSLKGRKKTKNTSTKKKRKTNSSKTKK